MASRSGKTWLCFNMVTNVGLCAAMTIAGQTCPAQTPLLLPDSPVPPQPSHELRMLAASQEPRSYSAGTSHALVSAAARIAPRSVSHARVADSKFFFVNGLSLGMAIFDVELTQHCIASHQCREGNPFMPSSQVGQLSVAIGSTALGSFTSYWLKKHRSPYWWFPPIAGTASHAAGAATGLARGGV